MWVQSGDISQLKAWQGHQTLMQMSSEQSKISALLVSVSKLVYCPSSGRLVWDDYNKVFFLLILALVLANIHFHTINFSPSQPPCCQRFLLEDWLRWDHRCHSWINGQWNQVSQYATEYIPRILACSWQKSISIKSAVLLEDKHALNYDKSQQTKEMAKQGTIPKILANCKVPVCSG